MNKILLILIFLLASGHLNGQSIVKTIDRLNAGQSGNHQGSSSGELTIYQDPAIDTLISRHLEANRLAGGVDGYRIQVFRKSHRTAREEADKVMARLISDYPDLQAYQDFERPNFYIVRMGDFRTRIEAARMLVMVRKSFSDSYIVRQKIKLPETIK
jgi:hypothetical protein